MSLTKKIISEFSGTFFLILAVIGSGIMAEKLSGGNDGIALIANTLATVFALYVLIESLGPISGAQLNPAVSFIMYLRKKLTFREYVFYTLFQCIGAVLAAFAAHYLFGLEIFQFSQKARSAVPLFFSEVIATAGLMAVIFLSPADKVASLIASYIGAAYWFTSSTSFANPAAVLGRMLSNTFAGIRPEDAAYFIIAQFLGGYVAHKVGNKLQGQNN